MKIPLFLILIAIVVLAGFSCQYKKTGTDQTTIINDISDKEHARTTVAMTFGALSSVLKNEMSEGGVKQAVTYCNLNALAITDSMSTDRNVIIKRVTDRPRNPDNLLNAEEQPIFNYFQNAIATGQTYQDTFVVYPKRKVYYAPIRINDLCLKCHGDPETIPAYSAIANLYPEDKAIGYEVSELRGLWSVTYMESQY